MKKIVLFLIVLLIGKMNVLGLEMEVKRMEDVIYYNYEERKLGTRQVFKLTFDEYENFDNWLIANLAELGNYVNPFYKNVIQKMILENVNNYEVNLLDENGFVIDTKNYEEEILEMIKKYDKVPDINESYYEVMLNENLSININNGGYISDDYSVEDLGNKLIVSNFNKTGLQKIEFKSSCFLEGDDVISAGIRYKPFTIYVNVLGYRVDFIVPVDSAFTLEVYDLDNNYIKTIEINEYENSFYYGYDEKFILKDVSLSIYERVDDIYLLGKDEKIVLNPDLRKFKINVKTFITDIFESEFVEVSNEFKILDKNLMEIYNCKSNEVCSFKLYYGDYYFFDLKSNRTFYYNISDDYDIELTRYYISGLVSNKSIDNIIINENDVDYEKIGNVYFIENQVIDSLKILFDEQIYELDLYDFDNYWFILNVGVFYNCNNIKKDEVIKDNDEKNNDDIQVPNDNNNDNEDNIIDLPNNDKKDEVIKISEDNDKHEEISIKVPNTNIEYNVSFVFKRKNHDEF